MDVYLVLKFLHVIAAILWVGAGILSTLLIHLAGRDGDRVLRTLAVFAPAMPILMMPSSLTVLVTGGTLVWLGAWGAAPWMLVALAATLASFVAGARVFGPAIGRAFALNEQGRRREAADTILRLALPLRIEQAALVLVVCLMVVKPGWEEMPLVGLFALGLFGIALKLTPANGRPQSA
ncbi:DUF2269 family protein [Salipiger sp.]|uniref:DUF2269 family protein n=1 Tax=Salipiger sp. TaxID=2078585 RepID=UPI003A972789